MVRQSLRGLAVAALAAFALSPLPAAAVTRLNACANLTKAGETYIVTADITAAGTCFLILADRITLDLGGHTVTGPGAGIGVWDGQAARIWTVVKNGSVTRFTDGIDLVESTRSTVRAVNASDNTTGMRIGPGSLVKDCIAQRNFEVGVRIGDGGQIEGCTIGGTEEEGNRLAGLAGGRRMLVTRNIVSGNRFGGIAVGINSTVTHNTANGNGDDGIVVNERSLVSHNTADDNRLDGIRVTCPSTITHNEASNNGSENFHFIGDGCFDNGTNTSPDEIGCSASDGLAAC